MEEIGKVEYQDVTSRIVLVDGEDIVPVDASLLVFDGNTASLFKERNPEISVILPPGESEKNIASIERVINRALSLSLGRDGLIVGIGGGVVTDITGFAASIFMRGCRLVLIPTTLLSMVDAAVGGKTGVDFGGFKNFIGTFYPAEEVRISINLLKTLSQREYLSGLAEVIKHAALCSAETNSVWKILENERDGVLARDSDVLSRLIPAALQVKVDIVNRDLKEAGERAFLNFGHTFAHALESATNFSRWSHGEAVAWGMLCALDMGENLDITDSGWAKALREMISAYNLGIVSPQVSAEEIFRAMSSDKKKKLGRLQFVLTRGPGDTLIREVPENVLKKVLNIR